MLMKGASYQEVLDYMEEHDKEQPDNPFGIAAEEASREEAVVKEGEQTKATESEEKPQENAEDTKDKSDKE